MILAPLIVILAAAAAIPLSASAPQFAAPSTIAGHWAGLLELPGQKLDFDVDFAAKGGGSRSPFRFLFFLRLTSTRNRLKLVNIIRNEADPSYLNKRLKAK